MIAIQAGKVHDAIPLLQKAKALDAPPFVTAWLGYAYGASGDRKRAMATIDELEQRSLNGYVPPFNRAIVHLGLGDHARALDDFEKAFEAKSEWLIYLRGPDLGSPPLRPPIRGSDEEARPGQMSRRQSLSRPSAPPFSSSRP